MTWGEFKRIVEANGIKDDCEVESINWEGIDEVHVDICPGNHRVNMMRRDKSFIIF